jgi:hypothetical protein
MRKFPIRREKYYTIESVYAVQQLEGRDVSERVTPGRIGKSPEGHRNVYYFTPKIRVPLRAPQAEATHANAKT